MSTLVKGLILAGAAAFALPTVSAAKSAPKDQASSAEKADKAEAAAPLDKEAQQKLKEHVRMREHIKSAKYPATKDSLVTAFKGFKDVKAGDKKWFEETLPSKTFDSPEDVMKALGWEVTPADTKTSAKSGK